MSIAGRGLKALTRWFGARAPRPTSLPVALPEWADVGKGRKAHIERVVALLDEWAEEMGVSARERNRWLKAGWLHDALRGARLPSGVTHGAAAADKAEREGESDRGVLEAVRYHSVGYAGWGAVGKMLYLADYLEPGRKRRRKERAELAERVARDPDGVLREVVSQQIRARIRAQRPVPTLTLDFWNAIVKG